MRNTFFYSQVGVLLAYTLLSKIRRATKSLLEENELDDRSVLISTLNAANYGT